MTFEEYQKRAWALAIYPERGNNYMYAALGIAGESGEVCEKVKKILRDKAGLLADEDRAALKAELGDVLWYVAAMATEIGVRLGDVAEANLAKLEDRTARGVRRGSGDDR